MVDGVRTVTPGAAAGRWGLTKPRCILGLLQELAIQEVDEGLQGPGAMFIESKPQMWLINAFSGDLRIAGAPEHRTNCAYLFSPHFLRAVTILSFDPQFVSLMGGQVMLPTLQTNMPEWQSANCCQSLQTVLRSLSFPRRLCSARCCSVDLSRQPIALLLA